MPKREAAQMQAQEGKAAESSDSNRPPLADLEAALGYQFSDPTLLQTALQHSSYAHEEGNVQSNERLEFLGDAVIGPAVAHLHYAVHDT